MAQSPPPDPETAQFPRPFHIGPVTVQPSGFVESIGVYRSSTTHDDGSTRLGSFPLVDTPDEALVTFDHSRIQAKAEMRLGPGTLSGWFESDFQNRAPLQPYRIRQFYGQYSVGGWEFSAGQEWSLMRPNRKGLESEGGLMNTRVAEPAYHVGLMGYRNHQVRVARHFGNWHAALSFENGRDFLPKLVRDSKRLHLEFIGLTGRGGHHGASMAAVVHVSPKIDWVNQQAWVRKGGKDALGVVPTTVPATSTIQGIEVKVTRAFQVYGYGGLVYGERSAGNRIVREGSVGFTWEFIHNRVGHAILNMQIAQLNRAIWSGPSGNMTVFMASVRQFFGGAR